MCSEEPAWKRLISHALDPHERLSLIMAIFSDCDQVEMVTNLFGDDAQNFINAIDVVSTCALSLPRGGSVFSHSNPSTLSIRHWIASTYNSAGGACAFYTQFVVVRCCFRNHWRFYLITSKGF
jgi:hypothetical protein